MAGAGNIMEIFWEDLARLWVFGLASGEAAPAAAGQQESYTSVPSRHVAITTKYRYFSDYNTPLHYGYRRWDDWCVVGVWPSRQIACAARPSLRPPSP